MFPGHWQLLMPHPENVGRSPEFSTDKREYVLEYGRITLIVGNRALKDTHFWYSNFETPHSPPEPPAAARM